MTVTHFTVDATQSPTLIKWQSVPKTQKFSYKSFWFHDNYLVQLQELGPRLHKAFCDGDGDGDDGDGDGGLVRLCWKEQQLNLDGNLNRQYNNWPKSSKDLSKNKIPEFVQEGAGAEEES